MAEFDYNDFRDHKAFSAFMPLARFLTKIVYNVRFEGMEHFPKEGGYILAPNHIVAVDPVYISTRVPQPVHYMGKQEAFGNAFTKWFLTSFNSFPVARGTGDQQAIDYAVKLLEHGKVLGIFPEGTRSKDGKLGRAKSGVAHIAKAAHADVMPVSVRFEGKPKFRAKVVVRYGEIIPYDDLHLDEDSPAVYRRASKYIMEKIAELWEGTEF